LRFSSTANVGLQWKELFRAQGMKNLTPRIQMIEGFNVGRIEFEGGFEGSVKGETSLKTVLEENGSGCSQAGRIGLGIFFFKRRRTVKTQQMTKYILGGVIAVGFTFFSASSNAQAKEKKMNEALTINGDGAQRNPDIHWPKGQHPEDADLFAHNEIMVNASCEIVFANIVDGQSWPSWYPNSHNVVVHDSPDNKLLEGAKFSWDTFGG
jgi:hypothetical protein